MLIDTHCHLDAKRFNHDRTEVLQRARAAGVEKLITIGVDLPGSERAFALAQTHDDVFCTVGIHPHEAESAPDGFTDALRTMAAHPKVVAIGECGLDYYYDHSPREKQQAVFVEHIALALELDLPLIVHVRDAWPDCLALLEKHGESADGARVRGVIHCFTGTAENAADALKLGFYLSIPGVVTFKKAGDLHEVVPTIPADKILVETDAPYLAPTPYRGKRNEPAYVKHVAEKVAELRGESLAHVLETTGRNAHALFGL